MKRIKYTLLNLFLVIFIIGCASKNEVTKIEEIKTQKNYNNDIHYYKCGKNIKKENGSENYIVKSFAINYSAIDTGETPEQKLNQFITKNKFDKCWESKKKP